MTRTILAVLAHPDDESFGIGGTLALYSRQGCDTYLICATRGEEGSMAEEHLNGYKDKAELRTSELQKAARHLGLKEVFILGYRDSGMPGTDANKHPDAQINHPLDEVAALKSSNISVRLSRISSSRLTRLADINILTTSIFIRRQNLPSKKRMTHPSTPKLARRLNRVHSTIRFSRAAS